GRLPGSENGVGATDLSNPNSRGGFGPNGAGGAGLNESLDARNKLEDYDLLAADTIYFDFDKSNVKSQYAANITRVADYLKAHPADSLLVEGHCDDRGTEDYNLALGERRAQSVREKLMAAGVSGDRVTTISYGKEKPAVIGNTEAAYAKNRRAVFVVLMPPGGVR
ncbi:MAG TPA: peptidoglycan-associated lipoprotein Pal, partial [Verrucomicrobiota bacterium]|nr:peptidoglycan-associated lipoprotein Pal [Verrucomicrobiota bacterium]